jgi:hypothetical protein
LPSRLVAHHPRLVRTDSFPLVASPVHSDHTPLATNKNHFFFFSFSPLRAQMLSKLALSSLLVAATHATFPPTNLDTACANLQADALTTCFQQQFDAQQQADAAAIDAQAAQDVAKQQSDSLAVVKVKAQNLQLGINAGAVGARLWCEGEFIAAFLALVGADACKAFCGQFATNAVDASASQKAFECLIPLTSNAVDTATDQTARADAVDLKTKAALLFVATQFADNNVVISTNNDGTKVTDFSDNVKDLAFNAQEVANAAKLQTAADDNAEARVTETDTTASAIDQQFASFFIPKLEARADLTQSRTDLRDPAGFGGAAQTVFDAADTEFKAIDPNGTPSTNVVFTDLGQFDAILSTGTSQDPTQFVTKDLALVNPATKKRAAKATQVGALGQNAKEILANKLALVAFCKLNALACKSSRVGAVSQEQFAEAKVETKAEEAARLAALTTAYVDTTTKYVAATTKYHAPPEPEAPSGGGYNAPAPAQPAVDQHNNNGASSLMLAAGAVLATVAMFL